jgi:hypothetical protein
MAWLSEDSLARLMQAVCLAKLSWDLCPNRKNARDFRGLTEAVVREGRLTPSEAAVCSALFRECESWQWSTANLQEPMTCS